MKAKHRHLWFRLFLSCLVVFLISFRLVYAQSVVTIHPNVILHTSNAEVTPATTLYLPHLECETNRLLFNTTYWGIYGSPTITLNDFDESKATVDFTADGTDTTYNWTWSPNNPYVKEVDGQVTVLTLQQYSSSQLQFTASTNDNAEVVVVSGGSKPTYVLNAKNYSYANPHVTMYAQTGSNTVTADFGTTYASGLKLVQAPTLASPPTYDTVNKQFTFTASGSGTQTVKLYCADEGKPVYIRINNVQHEEGDKWTYSDAAKTLTITESFSTKTFKVYWKKTPSEGTGTTLIEQYLLQKDLLGFIQAMYTIRIGEMFYVILMLIAITPIYMRTQSLTYVCVIWLLFGSIMIATLPAAAFHLGWVFLVLGLAGLLWKAFR